MYCTVTVVIRDIVAVLKELIVDAPLSKGSGVGRFHFNVTMFIGMCMLLYIYGLKHSYCMGT